MKRKIIAVLLALVLSLSMAVCAQAASVTYVTDEFGNLSRLELMKLNVIAANIYEDRGVGIFFVYTTAEDLTEYDIYQVVGEEENYFVMMENEDSWYTFIGGKGALIDEDAEEALRDVYDEVDTYVGGVEAFLYAAAEYFPMAAENTAVVTDAPTTAPTSTPTAVPTTVPTSTPTVVPTTVPTTVPTAVPTKAPTQVPTAVPTSAPIDNTEYVLFDEADLLSVSQEAELNEKLLAVSHKLNAQIVIATVNSVSGRTVDQYIEDVYDSMGFGYGANRDGVLLLVSMNPRAYRILSNGFAGNAIEMDQIDAIGSAIVSDLSEGDYADAFDTFVDRCEYYINGYVNGFPFDASKNLLISVGIGVAIGLIVVFILRSQLTSVRMQSQASAYIKKGSMNVTVRRDTFLYRRVSRTKKETNNNSSSSGGSSRNVGGGSF